MLRISLSPTEAAGSGAQRQLPKVPTYLYAYLLRTYSVGTKLNPFIPTPVRLELPTYLTYLR